MHIGYAGPSGASDKALAALAHYGLTEKTGKSELRVSQLALDIIHPDPSTPASEKKALLEAGMSPQIFKDLRTRFPDHVSEDSLRSYLIREGFQNIAISPVMNAFFETFRFLEQSKAFESGGLGGSATAESSSQDDTDSADALVVYGGARVGDLIQWESDGVLRMEQPMRIRLVSDDGQWVAVDGSETGIPMNEVIVEERAAAASPPPPPMFKLAAETGGRDEQNKFSFNGTEWMRNRVGRDTTVALMVSGEMGPKEIARLIKLLEAQKAVLDDEEEHDL
jgi:hypothetical protein